MSKCRRYGNNSAWSWLCLYHAPLIQSFIKWLHLLLMNTHLEWTLKSSQKAQKEKSLSVTNSPVTLWYVHTDTVIVFLSVFYHWTWLRSVCQPSWRIRWNVNRSVFFHHGSTVTCQVRTQQDGELNSPLSLIIVIPQQWLLSEGSSPFQCCNTHFIMYQIWQWDLNTMGADARLERTHLHNCAWWVVHSENVCMSESY